MKILLSLTFVALLCICGLCSKEYHMDPCREHSTGLLDITNNTPDRYKLFIDEVEQVGVVFLPGTKGSFELPVGEHTIKVVQTTGVISGGTPMIYAYNPEISLCDTKEIIFP
jgi:hypothetical protein